MSELQEWSPERKIVGGAVAVLVLYLVQLFSGVEVPSGVEGALAVLVAYFVPNQKA